MFGEKIQESARSVVERLESFPDIADNELQTKISLIEPVLRSLGYDTTHPEQVTLEVATELGGKIDYMLTGKSRATIAVEAKRAGMSLSDRETKQLRAYFTFSEAVCGILTNGVTYWLFTDLEKRNVMDLYPYRRIDIRSITDDDLSHLRCLARREVSQDRVHHQARNERYQSQINSIVAEELAAPSQEFLKLVGRQAGIKPLNKTNLAFLRPLVERSISRSLASQPPLSPIADPQPRTSEPEAPIGATTAASGLTPGKKAAATLRQFEGATLFGNPIACKNYTEMLISVVKELQTRHPHDFDERVSDSAKFQGRKWWYISRSIDDLNPHPSHSKNEVGGYWLDTNLNAKNKVKRAQVFLRGFGYDPTDLEVHTSEQ